jgi:hypothetical protein
MAAIAIVALVLPVHAADDTISVATKKYVDSAVMSRVRNTEIATLIANGITAKEDTANKVSTAGITAAATDTQYPTARAVFEITNAKVGKTGDETVNGIKTFVVSPIVPTQPLPTP